MTTFDASIMDRVHEMLFDVLLAARRTSRVRWQIATPGGYAGAAYLDHQWLTLDFALGPARPSSLSRPDPLFRLLHWNAALPGLSKFVIWPNDRYLRLRSEILVDAQTPYEDRLRRICLDLDSAFRVFDDRPCDTGRTQTLESPDAPSCTCVDIESLCRDADLPIHRGVDGAVTTASAIDESTRIRLEPTTESGLRLSADLPTPDETGHHQCRAIALMLLLATASIRMVRAVARPKGDRKVVSLEIEFPHKADAADVAEARAALSIAIAHSSAEARFLQYEELAHRYLARQGFGAPLESEGFSEKEGATQWSQQLQTSST